MIEIYVDGSAINNENPNIPTLGGVGVCAIYNGKTERLWRVESKVFGDFYTVTNDVLEAPTSGLNLGKTTNNTTELAAIYMALKLVKGRVTNSKGEGAVIYGDSQYAGNLVFGNWKPKENKELVAKVKQLASEVPNVTWEYVKAHADNQYNNYADYLARSGAYKTPQEQVLSFNEWLSSEQI
jgi:ribonuclease HI